MLTAALLTLLLPAAHGLVIGCFLADAERSRPRFWAGHPRPDVLT